MRVSTYRRPRSEVNRTFRLWSPVWVGFGWQGGMINGVVARIGWRTHRGVYVTWPRMQRPTRGRPRTPHTTGAVCIWLRGQWMPLDVLEREPFPVTPVETARRWWV